MKRLLCIVGAVSLVLFLAVGVGIAMLVHRGNALDSEAQAFVDTAVPAIATHWSRAELLDRAGPDFRSKTPPAQIDALFERFSQLGMLVRYEGARGQALMNYSTGAGSRLTASYVARAKFENGEATFRISLLKLDGRWTIQGFFVDAAPAARSAGGA